MSKTIYGLTAKYYNYISKVFGTVCEYYNYELVSPATKEINKEIEAIKSEPSKFYYNELEAMGITSIGFTSRMIDAEIISLAYRFLEEIGITDLTIKINTKEKELLNHLNYLDVDYEQNDKTEVSLSEDNVMAFEIVTEKEDREVVLCSGTRANNNIVTVSIPTEKVVEILESISNIKTDKAIDIYITATSEEEKLTAIRLIQDIRWSEITAEMDYLEKNLEEQLKEADKLNARMVILLNNEDLQKGMITVKDNLTKEETKVDESEILDYIISNL